MMCFLLLCYAAFLVNKVGASCTPTATYTGLTIKGNDLSQVSGNFSSCCQSCTTTTGCVAYSWTNGTCYLKSDTQPLYKSSSYSTGVLTPTSNQTYSLQKSYNGSTFFSNFNFISYTDPSGGDVNYTTQAQATALKLVSVLPNGQVFIGVDNVTVVPLNATRGRAAVRIESIPLYNSGLFILNLAHMPEGVGTWPAFWSYGPSWPNNGEIDILEGVSAFNYNSITLHTNQNCSMTSDANNYINGTWNYGRNSTIIATDCWVNDPNQWSNQGCGISAPAGTFNTGFNQAGGGVFAMEWVRSKSIRIWNFVNPNIPADISSANPNPSTWGLPNAYFALGSNCSASHFNNNTLTINTDLCGWAGQYVTNCSTVVRSNPQNFTNAYWLINYLNVYCLPNDPNCVLP